jgi:hypothetical protein
MEFWEQFSSLIKGRFIDLRISSKTLVAGDDACLSFQSLELDYRWSNFPWWSALTSLLQLTLVFPVSC